MQCTAVLPTKKVKSFPPTQQGDFQNRVALKSDSKHKTQRLGKDKGVISPFFFFLTILSLCERVFTLFVVSASSLFITKPLLPLSSARVKNMDFYQQHSMRFDSAFGRC